MRPDRAPWPLSLRLGLSLVVAHLVLAALGPWIAPFGPSQMRAGIPLSGASLAHPFGLDQLGRDVFSRALHGGHLVLAMALGGTLAGFLPGAALGLVSGYRGGRFDSLAMRACEVLVSLPVLVTALLVVALVDAGPAGTMGLIVGVVGLVYAPRIARVVRSAAIEVAQRDFVTAARLRGEPALRLALREIAPNILGTMLVEFALRASYAPVLVASLGFLSFGLPPPSPEWGVIMAENRPLLFLSPASVLGPGAMLATLVIGINLTTEGAARLAGRRVERSV
jgi:peptide/nickel transport system permease protein